MFVINFNEKKVKIKVVGKNMVFEYLFFYSFILRSLFRIFLSRVYCWIRVVIFNLDF